MSDKDTHANDQDGYISSDDYQVFDSRYVVRRPICKTASGSFFVGRDLELVKSIELASDVIIQILPDRFAKSETAFQTLQEEIKHLQSLSLPFLPEITASGVDEGEAYLILTYIAGSTLKQELEQAHSEGLSLEESVDLLHRFKKITDTLSKHNMTHTQLGLDTLYLTRTGEFKVLGSEVVFAKQKLLAGDDGFGCTIPNRGAIYTSPEGCFGQEPSQEDDVYSFAAMTYEMVTGKHPFDGNNSLQAIMKKLIAEQPANLSEQQWGHLQKGLTLKKQSRIENLNEFINGFDIKKETKKADTPKKKTPPATPKAEKRTAVPSSTPTKPAEKTPAVTADIKKEVQLPKKPVQKKAPPKPEVEIPSIPIPTPSPSPTASLVKETTAAKQAKSKIELETTSHATPPPQQPSSGSSLPLIGGGIAAIAIIGGIAFTMIGGDDKTMPATAQPQTATKSVVTIKPSEEKAPSFQETLQGAVQTAIEVKNTEEQTQTNTTPTIESRLNNARNAINSGSDADKSQAIIQLRGILNEQADNPQAKEILGVIVDDYHNIALTHLKNKQVDDAAITLEKTQSLIDEFSLNSKVERQVKLQLRETIERQ